MTDADVIIALGDSAKVAELLSLPQNTVSNWKVRGISWPMRPVVWGIAKKRRVKLPEDFLTSKAPA